MTAAAPINLADRIELRRFVGRELLLWLWLESELFEATITTRAHGDVGLWLEGRLILNEGAESTTIKGTAPGLHREAKESLLRGKMPERVGLHLSFGDHDCTLTLRGETLAFAGLNPPKKEPAEVVDAPMPGPKKRSKKAEVFDEAHEAFYDRMHFVREVEALMTSLYQDFLELRLSPTWEKTVFPALESWVQGDELDVSRYRAARDKVLGKKAS